MTTEPKTTQKTPFPYASHWGRTIVFPSLRLFAYPLLMTLISFILSPVLMSEWMVLRIGANALLVALMIFLLGYHGAYRGEKDVQNSFHLLTLQENDKEPSRQELAAGFHPMKGIVTGLLGVAPWFVAAVLLALLTQPYVYQLQDLPSYLQAYLGVPDIGAALSYYGEKIATTPVDVLRVLVRLVIMPYVNMAGTLTDAVSMLMDRISPLLVCILPLSYVIGYLMGPRMYRRTLARNEAAKKAHRKKVARNQRKAKAQRATKKPEKII